MFIFTGLLTVHQTIRKFQPIDELKRASFRLEAGVAEYRPVDSGVEVDIRLKAIKADHPVWESVVTMLSPRDSPAFNVQFQTSDNGKREQKALDWAKYRFENKSELFHIFAVLIKCMYVCIHACIY